ncbi:Nucleic acid dioxygenase ALKBH1 like protein [Argiope bruennichi]|uniref:Nucleic acid dioxygenase ALKBH1 like protein n=1 Tax=Argiope bruennichi TaxID=94029 RepID=A0A8T0EF08_ARGBR|nr:Nucleic acid dioxygenase ALKBH1 like protein [Argiope bruennichi]
MNERDFFKEEFKYYKKKNPPPNLNRVIDFDLKCNFDAIVCVKEQYLQTMANESQCVLCEQLSLRNHSTWNLFSIKSLNGFIYIQNPFTCSGQQKWIRKCLEVYPRKPSVTNLDLHYKNVDDIWSLRDSSDPIQRQYLPKLCWATLGYHHNWDTKVYDPSSRSEFPDCLENLSKHIAECLGFATFKPEAAIVNYYSLKSSLSIHNDHSEEAVDAPIISFSFGQTGVFLIGTENKFEKPFSMLLRSGDIIVMSKSCRLSYHAVPCILTENVVNRYS